MRKCGECGTVLHPGVRVCPECGARYGGRGSLNQAPKTTVEDAQRHYEAVERSSVTRVQAQAERWLRARGLMPAEDESKPECSARPARFRVKLQKTPRPHPMQWAQDVRQAVEDGEDVPPYSVRLANQVSFYGLNPA